eukprot:TRINITY_DN2437_c0_g1_i24.p1 TRINITY_DN2437_c0_g1~~TRINITY_DN2437_c0_g1_i24.p1  ORF type:complete len:451 (-),score=75.73 TRINITY_DN2437_c0_g1_i24:118-1470(-)
MSVLGTVTNNGLKLTQTATASFASKHIPSTAMFVFEVPTEQPSTPIVSIKTDDGMYELRYDAGDKYKMLLKYFNRKTGSGKDILELNFSYDLKSDILTLAFTLYKDDDNKPFARLSLMNKERTQDYAEFHKIEEEIADFSTFDIEFQATGCTFYYMTMLKETDEARIEALMDQVRSIHTFSTSIDFSACRNSFGPCCTILENLMVGFGDIRKYSCSCIEGYGYDAQRVECVPLSDNCSPYCACGCSSYDEHKCYKFCTSAVSSYDGNSDFYACATDNEEKSSHGAGFWILAIGLPIVIVAAAVGVVIWLVHTGRLPWLEKYLKCLRRTDKGTVDTPNETAPNKITNNCVTEDVVGAEGGMKESRSNLIASRNYLDPSSLQVTVPSNIPEQKLDMAKDEAPAVQLGTCGLCNTSNVNLLPVFSCGHYSLCWECADKAVVCPSCGDTVKAKS